MNDIIDCIIESINSFGFDKNVSLYVIEKLNDKLEIDNKNALVSALIEKINNIQLNNISVVEDIIIDYFTCNLANKINNNDLSPLTIKKGYSILIDKGDYQNTFTGNLERLTYKAKSFIAFIDTSYLYYLDKLFNNNEGIKKDYFNLIDNKIKNIKIIKDLILNEASKIFDNNSNIIPFMKLNGLLVNIYSYMFMFASNINLNSIDIEYFELLINKLEKYKYQVIANESIISYDNFKLYMFNKGE